ncbi:HNH endonuclease [Paraburkholderia sp. MM6662-R1]|uniref:HNH endonuclease n=1 Tax=Paraburkholderia sp. MM6662-R1 TaxID=2991066 RepID=UPI003D1F22FE
MLLNRVSNDTDMLILVLDLPAEDQANPHRMMQTLRDRGYQVSRQRVSRLVTDCADKADDRADRDGGFWTRDLADKLYFRRARIDRARVDDSVLVEIMRGMRDACEQRRIQQLVDEIRKAGFEVSMPRAERLIPLALDLDRAAPAMVVSASRFEAKLERFYQVQARPDQADFREAVYRACQGMCVISGCDVPEAVEAAHLAGRNWRDGHNTSDDGILLRRDLHALYDAGLLIISDDGLVSLDPTAASHYEQFEGVRIMATVSACTVMQITGVAK